jgi:hypothetical protein
LPTVPRWGDGPRRSPLRGRDGGAAGQQPPSERERGLGAFAALENCASCAPMHSPRPFAVQDSAPGPAGQRRLSVRPGRPSATPNARAGRPQRTSFSYSCGQLERRLAGGREGSVGPVILARALSSLDLISCAPNCTHRAEPAHCSGRLPSTRIIPGSAITQPVQARPLKHSGAPHRKPMSTAKGTLHSFIPTHPDLLQTFVHFTCLHGGALLRENVACACAGLRRHASQGSGAGNCPAVQGTGAGPYIRQHPHSHPLLN